MAQQERGIRTRRLILEIAGAVFAERGYEGAALTDVYTRAGLSKGAFYFHFASKQELAQAVLDGQVGQDAYPVVPQAVKLQELIDAGLVFAHLLGRDPILQGSIRLSLELGTHGFDRQGPFRDWIAHNQANLTEALDRGELYRHVDPAETAELLVGAFSGVQLLSKVMTNHSDLEHRVSVLLLNILPAIAVPGILVRLDMSPDRGRRVLAEAERQYAAAAAEAADQDAGAGAPEAAPAV